MIVDLRLALTIILLLSTALLLLGWWWGRHSAHPATSMPTSTGWLDAWEHAPIALLWLAIDGKILSANAAARALIRVPGLIQGQSLPEADWTAQLLDDMQRVVGATDAGRARTVGLADQHAWHWWVTPWAGGALVFIEDVSALQQAEQATHLLLSDLGHELRTPLATLGAHLEVLRLPNVTPETHEQSLQFLRDETQRLVRLVNNVLELGRVQTRGRDEMRYLSLFPLVEGVVAQLHTEAQSAQVRVQIDAAPNLPAMIGQADLLKQLFLNLLDNSIKYCRPGDQVTIGLATADNRLHCTVCDTGPGIPAEHLPHVTKRFYRAVPSGISGSGLGLALAAEIVRQHGGELKIAAQTDPRKAGDHERSDASIGICVEFALPIPASQSGSIRMKEREA